MRNLDLSVGFEPMVWFWDQICLYFAIGTYYGEMSIHMVSRAMVLDDSFGKNSYFWASTGSNKDLIYEFFVKHASSKEVDLADAEQFMNYFSERAVHCWAYRFATHILNRDPNHKHAFFTLELIYFKELKNYDFSKKMFQVLRDSYFNVDDCNAYLDKIDLLTN